MFEKPEQLVLLQEQVLVLQQERERAEDTFQGREPT